MPVMTTEVPDSRRRKVSLSLPDAGSAPVDQSNEFVTRIGGVLLTLTDLLSASAHHFDRTRLRRATDVIAAAFHADLRGCPADPSARRKRRGGQ